VIYHILSHTAYHALDRAEPYRAESLDQEGFIHCTAEPDLLATVANRFYRNEKGPHLLLCIDETRVRPTVRWEEVDGHRFPHIYGPLNWDAVVQVIDFPRHADGRFVLPAGLV